MDLKVKNSVIAVSGFLLFCFALAEGLLTQPAYAGNAQNGMRIFHRCTACHYADRDGNKAGPSLKNVMHRRAGTEAGYKFSSAMIKAGKNGLVWNKETLAEFLHNPRAMVQGTRMPPIKITSEQERDDLISYLQEVSQQ